MDIDKIRRSQANRDTRNSHPYLNFMDHFQEAETAGNLVLAGKFEPSIERLVARAAIISTVTAIEVYFRDILDFSFRYCRRDILESHLKMLYPEKFDILQVLNIFDQDIHPLALVSSSQSFQNVERINKVFTAIFFPEGLWKTIFNMQIRRRDRPENIVSWSQSHLDGLRRTFNLRHEFVHDPPSKFSYSEELHNDLECAAHMVWGAEMVIPPAIEKNKDPNAALASD